MTKFNSDFMQILSERQFIHQCTDELELDDIFLRHTITGYIGFDCTANSLHVGSLVQIMMLRWMQITGHKPIILIGGGTTKIGDPTGRNKTRPQIDLEKVATGEFWLASEAKELGLVDEIMTSDDYLFSKLEDNEIIEIKTEDPRNKIEKLMKGGMTWIRNWLGKYTSMEDNDLNTLIPRN